MSSSSDSHGTHDLNAPPNGLEKAKKLTELMARVKSATGPDRELGHDILLATGWTAAPIYHEHRKGGGHFSEDWDGDDEYVKFDAANSQGFWRDQNGKVLSAQELPDLTASIDAIVALIERKLPGHQVNISSYASAGAEASIGARSIYAGDLQPTAPLALCLALLTTLQSIDTGGGEG